MEEDLNGKIKKVIFMTKVLVQDQIIPKDKVPRQSIKENHKFLMQAKIIKF